MNGKIVSVSPEQGVGVIAPEEEGGELSFRSTALHGIALDDLTEGMDVEFLLGQEAGARPSDGLRVVDVRPAEAKVAAATTDDETPSD
jgi:cold shock CspA family protein